MNASEIRRIRKGLGLTQTELAQLLGVHSITVSKWELGTATPTSYQIGLLSEFGKAVMKDEVSDWLKTTLVTAGVITALYLLLQAAKK